MTETIYTKSRDIGSRIVTSERLGLVTTTSEVIGDLLVALSQFREHGFHLALGVKIAGAAGGGDTVREHRLGVGDSVGAGESLGGHEVAGSIVRAGFQQDGEFCQGAIKVALLGVFHCKAVAGEGVVRILSEDVVEGGDTVHGAVAGGQWPVQDEITTNCALPGIALGANIGLHSLG